MLLLDWWKTGMWKCLVHSLLALGSLLLLLPLLLPLLLCLKLM
jgi:hypothetical protein